jgi:hypothetical protein
MPPAKSALNKLLDLAAAFVTQQKGVWNHEDWEALLGKAEKLGFAVDDEGKRNLGNVLEASKYFYGVMPAPPAKKKAAPRKKKAAG